jgi:hypothetical protein
MRLNRQFMGCEMVAFPVGGRCGGVSVRGKVMQFCNPVMDTLWHNVSPAYEMFRKVYPIFEMSDYDEKFEIGFP